MSIRYTWPKYPWRPKPQRQPAPPYRGNDLRELVDSLRGPTIERYSPKPTDVAILTEAFPEADPAFPPWGLIQARIVATGASPVFADLEAAAAVALLGGGSRQAEVLAIPTKQATVNSRMIDLLLKDPATHIWSAQKFATRLGCSKSTVAETAAWRQLRMTREMARQERAAKAQKANQQRPTRRRN